MENFELKSIITELFKKEQIEQTQLPNLAKDLWIKETQ